MKRREAIKGMGLSFGFALAAPTTFSLLQSCNTDIEKWVPRFLSTDQGIVVKNLVDLILPTTDDSPGALDVNIPEFIDLFYGKVLDAENQAKFSTRYQAIIEELLISSEKTEVSSLMPEDYDNILIKYLKASKEEQEELKEDDRDVLNAIVNLRTISVWAFVRTEEIGERVLAYDPIPGEQKGCIPLEATGGKKWSL